LYFWPGRKLLLSYSLPDYAASTFFAVFCFGSGCFGFDFDFYDYLFEADLLLGGERYLYSDYLLFFEWLDLPFLFDVGLPVFLLFFMSV